MEIGPRVQFSVKLKIVMTFGDRTQKGVKKGVKHFFEQECHLAGKHKILNNLIKIRSLTL